MAFQLSPGVNVSEIDLTTVVPSVLTTAGAFAGYFNWGPVSKIILVDSEQTLLTRFTASTLIGPDANSAVNFLTSASFLAYGNNLSVVRAVGAAAKNASSNATNQIFVANRDTFEAANYITNGNANTTGPFMARYAGSLGASLQVDVYDANSTTNFATSTFTSGGVIRNWNSLFSVAPNTSTYVASAGGAFDELHVVVSDAGGLFTGTKGTILETYPFVSKAYDAALNGSSNYWKQVIFDKSLFVYAVDAVEYATTNATWGKGSTTSFAKTVVNPTSITFTGGVDSLPTDGNLQTAYGLFTNKEQINISLVLTAGANTPVQQYVIQSVADATAGRGDCVAFVSPPLTAVVNNAGSETSSIATWLGQLNAYSSYAVVDSGWKYMYDKYNNVYRWIPLNGDVAGLCVYTDEIRDPWFSPAGLNRGQIKNAIKLAWNPSKTYRDTLYAAGVNPVVTLPGQGTVLFGDKTLQTKPSAFDRINVRRLFIVLEKAISDAARYSMFELNDTFTQSQFVALVTPFLRDVQGRRGITDFKVVCNSTNNTQQVIDSNQFVGDIYIKPARSINFIQLNFVAVGTGVDFSTIVSAA
jgi:hypothetical protein